MSAAPELDALAERPVISIVMPAHDSEPRYLRKAVDSVRAQRYPDWELQIVDDGSTRRDSVREVERAAAADERITARFLSVRSGISAASNAGLEACGGDLVAFLDHDDVLDPDALLQVAAAFADEDIDLAYSDQDKITADDRGADTFLKPDWSPVYALGAMYVGHLLVVRRRLLEEAGGLDPEFDSIQDFELVLRLSERTAKIHHIPEILYRWRAIPGSIAAGPSEKEGITELQSRAVNDHLRRRGIAAEAVPHPSIPHRLRLRGLGSAERPTVSVVVPARGASDRWRTVLDRTDHPRLEVIVVEQGSIAGERGNRNGYVRLAEPLPSFSPAALANAGARRASGEYLVFLGEEVEVTEPDWVDQLLLYAQLPGVGAVGPTLTDPDGLVAAAGIAIGLYDPAVPVLRGSLSDVDGYYGSLSCAREVSGVGMDCLLVSRAAFERLGGFEAAYRRQFADVDLCLRLAELGLSTICVPGPQTVAHQSEASRRADFDVIDRALFVDRWWERLEAGDPYYHRGFFRAAADYTLVAQTGDRFEAAMLGSAR